MLFLLSPAWSPKATEKNARQAELAFTGDVSDGLIAKTLGDGN
jgi:hypothetical protein